MSSWIKLVLISLGTLTEIRFIISWIVSIECSSCFSEHLIVVARARLVRVFLLFVLAIRYFRQEIACISLCIKCSSCFFIDCFVLTWSRVLLIWKPGIFNIDRRLEKFPLVFWSLEISNWCMLLNSVDVWIVKSRANCVLVTPRIHILWEFLCWNGGCLRLWLVYLISMLDW